MSSLTILVAVDIVEDQVVRLTKGEMEEKTVYGDDPIETALDWEKQGAKWLHVVDLDGATKGDQRNSKAIEEILNSTTIPVEVGGGIRTIEAIAGWVERGAARVCIGTKSMDPQFLDEAVKEFGDKLLVAVDAHGGIVRVGGWQQVSGTPTLDAVRRIADAGVSRIMFTDIERDGTLMGPNLESIEEVLDAVDLPIIASGGVTSEHDISALAKLAPKGLEGVIIGKALYTGAIKLAAAHDAASG